MKLSDFPIIDEKDLRLQCEAVKTKEEAFQIKVELEKYFPEDGAYAVAAPQIGIQKSAFLAHLPPVYKGQEWEWVFCCNPEILDEYDEFVFPNEGCLSFPGKNKHTLRFEYAKVKYFDKELKERNVVVQQIQAVIFQHEIDHLNGVLYFDHKVDMTVRKEAKIGRNQLCPCNSGKKYKKCCIK